MKRYALRVLTADHISFEIVGDEEKEKEKKKLHIPTGKEMFLYNARKPL